MVIAPSQRRQATCELRNGTSSPVNCPTRPWPPFGAPGPQDSITLMPIAGRLNAEARGVEGATSYFNITGAA
jgi:hypothetical protein